MRKLMIGFVCLLTACNGGGETASVNTTTIADSTPTVTPTPTTTPTPTPTASPEPQVEPISANQISFINVSPQHVKASSGENVVLDFLAYDPLSASKCTWTMEIPAQPAYPTGLAEATFGTLNGPCAAYTHNQYNSLNFIYRLYINNGETFASVRWDVDYDSGSVNNPVAVTAITPSGLRRVLGSELFQVDRTDLDGDAACTWKMDGVTVSTSCVAYTVTAASSTRTLVYTIDDGVNAPASVSWTIKPMAKITSVSPNSAEVGMGSSQAFTAAVTDPNSSGALCEWKLNGSVEQRGSCSYTYTRSTAGTQQIDVEIVYDAGGVSRSGIVKTVYAAPQGNRGVSILGSTPAAVTSYFAEGATSTVFGVTSADDPDSDAHYEWYINNQLVNCDTSPKCSYTSGSNNGIQLDNYSGERMVIKVVLTDGQYSASKTWVAQLDRSEIDGSIVAGTKCNTAGQTFTVWGRGFEASDTFTLEAQGVQLQVVSMTYSSAVLRVPQNVSTGSQAIKVVKGAQSDQTAFNFVTFTVDPLYCN